MVGTVLTSAMGITQCSPYCTVNTDWKRLGGGSFPGFVYQLHPHCWMETQGGARIGNLMLLANQDSNVQLDQTTCSVYKVGNKRYFRNPSSLHIPQTKHCYTMILKIYLEMIVTALKQQISGKASSGLYWHLEPSGDNTLFLKWRGKGGVGSQMRTLACFSANIFCFSKMKARIAWL